MRNFVIFVSLTLSFSTLLEAGLFQKRSVRNEVQTSESRAEDEKFRKMFAQSELVRESGQLEQSFQLAKAVEIAKKATGTEYITTERDKGRPLMSVFLCEVYLQNYEAALEASSEYVRVSPGNDWGIEQKQKIEALIEWQKTGNKQPIYDWIEAAKKKNAQWLPPLNIVFHSTGIMIQFVELYDLLGDYDAAIDYIQPFLKRHQAVRNNDYKINEHLSLIQALQESKQGLPKICIENGTVCLGRATAYIIKSKSF